jgi:hypothetical protein
MWKRIVVVSVLVSLAVAALLLPGGTPPPAGAEQPSPSFAGAPPAPRTNPFSDSWLAAYHGLFDNIWTAEYESRGQPPAQGPSVGGSLPRPLAPLEPLSDVRMSSPSFNTEQNEFQIDINPTNSQYAIGTSNDFRTAGVGIYRTSDGGSTWTAFDAPIGTAACCDPGVAYAYDGSVYVSVLDTSPFVTYVIRSTDNGVTWSAPTNVQTNDRPNIVVDNGAGSPRRGTVYLTYTDENASQQGSNRVKGYKSTDNGSTWGPTFFVGDVISSTGFEQGSQPRVASDGTLYVGYQQYTDINIGCGAGVQDTLAKSTDGGATWTYTVLPILQGGVCTPSQNGRGLFCFTSGGASFRSRSSPIIGVSPTNPQHVYMLYSGGDLEIPYTCAGLTGYHSDILFRISTDGGATFSAPAKVNTDPPGKDQYYPWMSVTANGTIWAGWHDRREDPNDFMHRWYESYSTDEGATWHKLDGSLGNEPIASVMSLPFGFIGDYAGLGAVGTTVLPMWWDSRIKPSGDPFTEVGPPIIFTPTPTRTGSPTPTSPPATNTATSTSTPTATNTAIQSTATATPVSQSPTPAATSTSAPPSPGTPTSIPTSTPTVCSLTFTDVPQGSTFYPYIRCLACRGIINGYSDGTFKPSNQVTRGQLSKIVSNSAGFNDPQTTQMFQDVPLGSTFQVYIGRLASRGYINGYQCGGAGEPCQPGNLPYFRPNNNATRGQISKIVSNAAGFNDPPSGQQFEDVAPGSAFYTYTFRLVSRNVMSGYHCGGAGEPCIPPDNLPYFRPNNNATRGQTSKIVANTFFPDCQTP